MNHNNRIALAKKALKGVSIGDAFGESFFGEREMVLDHIQNRTIPPTKWEFTDDTVMAIAIFEQLEQSGSIDQNDLARAFSDNHNKDLYRGYGATARRILREIGEGGDWQKISQSAFEGMGSMGNGASMRVGPIGAYYYDDLEKVKLLARQSAEITHYNEEAITGAIAVAIATGIATQVKLQNRTVTATEFIKQVIIHLPNTDTASKIKKALVVPYSYHIDTVSTILGNGTNILSQDTVPFSLWCAAHQLYNFEESIWKAVSILGDRDTICAIVGGITIMSSSEEKIPTTWFKAVEDIDSSKFRNQQ